MSSAEQQSTERAAAEQDVKGKGKAVQPEEEDDDSSDEEMGDESVAVEEDVEEDELAEIDTSNIIQGGRRTRGKAIDYTKAAAAEDAMEEDSEDDEDFKAPVDEEMH